VGALVLAFTILAVLLYLIRRPSAVAPDTSDAGRDGGAADARADAATIVRTKIEPRKKKPVDPVAIGQPQKIKCSAGSNRRGNEGNLCDGLPFFEEALVKAIKLNVDCAPKTGAEGTLNYVLTVDFQYKRVTVFPGQSGLWKGPQARQATDCVKKSLPAPQWEAIPHQYRYYMIAVLATYPVPEPLEGLPKFE
jgi:hypothetical protein